MMIQQIRDKASGWILTLIIGFIIVTFIPWGMQSYLGSSSKNAQVVVKVNGQAITQNQLDNVYQRLRQTMVAQFGQTFLLNQTAQTQLKQQALQQLITTAVLTRAAQHDGYRINTTQLQSLVAQMPAFQVDGKFSPQRFNEILANVNYTQAEFFQELANNLMINQVQTGITSSAFALPNEVTQALLLSEQKRDISYAIISAKSFLSTVQVSPKAIAAYYQQHLTDFNQPAKLSLQYIELTPASLNKQVQISKAQVQQYYQDNLAAYTQPKRWQIQQIEISSPSNANPAATKQVEDQVQNLIKALQSGQPIKQTAELKNTVQWVNETQLPIQAISGKTLQVGQLLGPIKTSFGWQINKLLAVKDVQPQPLSAVQSKIIQELQQQQVQQLFSDQVQQLTDLTYTNSSDLAAASQALHVPILTTDAFTQQGTKSGLTSNPKILAAAFSDSVLKQHNNSDPISLDDGSVIVLRVKDYQPAVTQSLNAVTEQIVPLLKHQLASQQAQQQSAALAQQLLSKAAPAKANQPTSNMTWQTRTNVNQQQAGIDPEILRAAFNLPFSSKTMSVTAVKLADGDYAVVKLLQVHQADITKVDAQQRRLSETDLTQEAGQLDYQLYMGDLMRQAKIKQPN